MGSGLTSRSADKQRRVQLVSEEYDTVCQSFMEILAIEEKEFGSSLYPGGDDSQLPRDDDGAALSRLSDVMKTELGKPGLLVDTHPLKSLGPFTIFSRHIWPLLNTTRNLVWLYHFLSEEFGAYCRSQARGQERV